MKKLLFISSYFLILLISKPNTLMSQNMIYNFDNNSDLKRWVVVNDDVMGGISSGNLFIENDGNGVFEGRISTAYNGGFSSLRFNCKKIFVKDNTHFKIRIKGDGKGYQFRIKSNRGDYYSYIISFKTSGKWETITIPIKEMYASFRGRKLDMKNFNSDYFEQITFLFGNKKDENFKLIIDNINLI
jgi:NADH dehydrogenase [ubiquinone] 1 alpha subcomplex assembly factor 1